MSGQMNIIILFAHCHLIKSKILPDVNEITVPNFEPRGYHTGNVLFPVLRKSVYLSAFYLFYILGDGSLGDNTK